MTEHDLVKTVRQIIKQELTGVWLGSLQQRSSQNRYGVKRFPTEAELPKCRYIQPFGIQARPPPDTQVMTVPVNGDPTHINIAGHFFEGVPELDVDDGEVMLYNNFGQVVYLKNGEIHLYSKGSGQPYMLGNVVKQLLSDVLQELQDLSTALASHTHATFPVDNPVPFVDAGTSFAAKKASPVDDGAINSTKIFGE